MSLSGSIRVLYDHQAFAFQSFGGISRYHADLWRKFERTPDIHAEIVVRFSDNANLAELTSLRGSYLPTASYRRPFPNSLFRKLRQKHTVALANRQHSLAALARGVFDVFHPTYYDPYFVNALPRIPVVLTVHDMIHEIFPDQFPLAEATTFQKETCIRHATHLIAVSETTKRDLKQFHRLPDDAITVIHHGSDLSPARISAAALPLPPRYLLYVGHRNGYKNGYFLWRALRRVILDTPDLHLLCAGGGAFDAEESAFLTSLGLQNRVHSQGASPAELVALYQRAEAFVFPSLYEGFGIPVLEAFNCGCPVLASDTPALKEIAADAAVYFDPKSADHIEESVTRVLNDRAFRSRLISAGTLRGRDFSVEKCARETARLYTALAGSC